MYLSTQMSQFTERPWQVVFRVQWPQEIIATICGRLPLQRKLNVGLWQAMQNSVTYMRQSRILHQANNTHTHRHATGAKVMRWTERYVTKLIICSFGWMNWKTTVANQLYLVSFPCFATNEVLFAIYFMVGRITWWRTKRPTYRTASSPERRARRQRYSLR